MRSAVPVLNAENVVVGVVVVSQFLSPEVSARAEFATEAYQSYQGLRVLRAPIQGIYQSVFLAVSLLILISATWLGLYLAKRITRPVQQLAEGARAIGEGRLDVRLEPETGDELGSLVEAFNMMAAELSTSRERLEQSRVDLERKNIEVDARRRYIETILERVATGVISLDAAGRISTVNGAAERLLGLERVGARPPGAERVRPRGSAAAAAARGRDRRDPNQRGVVQEITLARDDREIHLAAAATVLTGDDAARREGAVLVLDDVTPLIRAQRVAAWRDVARRLAHEIKNPLTPIQLSAERLRRHFSEAPPPTKALVGECTDAIIAEVEALKGLVDEFAQFARLRGPRMVPTDLNRLVDDTLQLYAGVLQQGTRAGRAAARSRRCRPCGSTPSRFVRSSSTSSTTRSRRSAGPRRAPGRTARRRRSRRRPRTIRANGVVRLVVSDNGPGVPPADRDKLFMPYYSTKGRGSGLGLAIVRRIVVEHGGGIEVGAAAPSGTHDSPSELPAA